MKHSQTVKSTPDLIGVMKLGASKSQQTLERIDQTPTNKPLKSNLSKDKQAPAGSKGMILFFELWGKYR